MQTYQIDYTGWFEEGGYCQFYPIINHNNLGFKEFYNKQKATKALSIQKKLAKFDLAPKVFSDIVKLEMVDLDDSSLNTTSDWGYVTEIADSKRCTKIALKDIQSLVDEIYDKTKLKFWDCHYYNMGLIKRNGKQKLVCIDTGKESFDGCANAWGNNDPGPKCGYCQKYNCKCEE